MRIIKVMELGRFKTFQNRDFMRIPEKELPIPAHISFSLVYCDYKFSSELHQRMKQSDSTLGRLFFRTQFLNASRASLLFKIELVDSDTNSVLVSQVFTHASFNKETRRGEMLPPWFNTVYMDGHDGSSATRQLKVQKRPANVFSTTYKVVPKDIDVLNHTNNKVYLRRCLDCSCKAAETQAEFSGLKHCSLSAWQLYFAKESRLGDELITYVWRDPELQFVLHFQIEKNAVEIFHCDMHFHPKNPSSL